jgi:hypothetical protein
MWREFAWAGARRLAGRDKPGAPRLLTDADLELALWAIGGCALLVNLWRHRYYIVDDAFVSLRYAANLLLHQDLSWNLGERVEGYTNLLHLLVTAGLGACGLDLVAAVHVVNFAALGLLLWAAHRGARMLAPDHGLARAVGGAMLLGSPQMAMWVWGGLEGLMVAALVTAAALPLFGAVFGRPEPDLRRLALAGLLLALAGATRPDAFLFVAAAAAALLLVEDWPWPRRLAAATMLSALPALCVVALTAWRWRYYGDVVPNTFYAKTAFDLSFRMAGGARYLLAAAMQVPLLACAGAATGNAPGPLSWPTRLLGLGGALYLLYVMSVGGDYMAGTRMAVPVLGVAALLLTEALRRLPPAQVRLWALAALLIIPTQATLMRAERMEPGAYIGKIVGDYVARAWPKDALIAVNCVGATPYYAPDHRFVDMLGLNDRTVAHREVTELRTPTQSWPGHAKGDGAYVLSRRPDFIIPGPADGKAIDEPWFLGDAELGDHAEFRRCYRLETAAVAYDPEFQVRGPRLRPNPLTLTYYRRVCPR